MNLMKEIHESLVNGNRRAMVEQIDDYDPYYFWNEYTHYLTTLYAKLESQYSYFKDAVISYHRIKNR